MNIEKQARWWRYAAWTAPFVALSLIVGEILLGFDSLVKITSIIIVTAFVATSVLWWWWVISKIVGVINGATRIEKNFENLLGEVKEIKKDVGNRQWREPDNYRHRKN